MPKNKIRVHKDDYFYDIKVAPNQKVVKTIKSQKVMNPDAVRIAIKSVSKEGFMLYMYLTLNKNDYTEALSIQNVSVATSLSERSYYSAVKELIEKKYLVKVPNEDYQNYYIFYHDKDSGA